MNFLLYFTVICYLSYSNGYTDNKVRKFPPNFMFGAATSAYQVEGGWNEDGKGPNIWDTFVHNDSSAIAGSFDGEVAADSYHQYKRDVEMLRELGVDFYRFSISWSRVLPTGFPNKINNKGIEYYNNLINELIKYNIKPVVTLYHFDLPQKLQDLGGWANPLSVQWFEDYAKIVFNEYSDRVDYWITINEPYSFCVKGYGNINFAPAVTVKGIAEYLCIKNALLAHAKAYRLYENEYKNKYRGMVGISLALNWYDPLNNTSPEDIEAANRARDFILNIYLNPIYSKDGDFPKRVKEIVAENSKVQGFPRSRLPELTNEEITLLKGSSDFIGVNHYTTFLITPRTTDISPSFTNDLSIQMSQGPKWRKSVANWLSCVPYGIYRVMIYINTEYSYPKMFITEHGWPTTAAMFDNSRVANIRQYLKAVLLALEDGTDLIGYTYWSLMDNVEWIAGVRDRFGLYQVDFDSANKTRSARLSALVYKHIIQTRVVDDDYKPDELDISITNNNIKTEL